MLQFYAAMAKGRSSFTVKPKHQSDAPVVVEDVLKIRRLLLKGLHDHRASVAFQARGIEARFELLIQDAEFRKDGLWMELRKLPADLGEGLEGDVTIYSPDIGIIGFHARLLDVYEDGWVNVGVPKRAIRTQKRVDPRYTVPSGYELTVDFKKPRVAQAAADGVTFNNVTNDRASLVQHWGFHTCRILDLSSTGLGFLVPKSETAEYPKGLKLKQLVIRLRGREITADAQVMSCLPQPGEFVKVGIRFLKIEEEDQDFLRSYVLEHLIQYDSFNEA
jgi:hypothetical protein